MFHSAIPVVAASALVTLFASFAPAQDMGVAFTNGVDGALELPYDPQFAPQSGLTVEAWVTYDDSTIPTGQGVRYPTIARQHYSGGGQESWFLRVNAGGQNTRQLRFRGSTAASNILVNWSFSPGQLSTWTHVAATFDANLVAIYVNGALVASQPGNGLPLVDFMGDLRVGKGAGSSSVVGNEVWNGEIDELRIWPFARTAAEIQATMNEKLAAVPGLVATWNFDGFYIDTSRGHILTPVGAVAFAANPLTLTPFVPAGTHGGSSPGCLGDLLLSPTSTPVSGNAAFGVACVQAPANAFAIWLIGFGPRPAPLPVSGVDVWIDPAAAVSLFTAADDLGVVRLGFPVPSGFAGLMFATQVGVLDPCGPQGVTASNAMTFVLQ